MVVALTSSAARHSGISGFSTCHYLILFSLSKRLQKRWKWLLAKDFDAPKCDLLY
jgi:hypothetical protein